MANNQDNNQAVDLAWDSSNPQWRRSKALYKMSGIDIRESEDDPSVIIVAQTTLGDKGLILTQKELHARARTLYPDKSYKIMPLTFSLDTDAITPEWIQEQMALYGVKPKDLVKQLALTKSSVSIIINGTRPIAASTKALIYYYFLSLKLGRIAYMDIQASELSEALELIRAKRAEQSHSTTDRALPNGNSID